MPKVRTVMQPDIVIDVPDDEHKVLLACGLLATEPAPAPVPAPTPRPAEQPTATAAPPATDAPAKGAEATTTKKG